MNNMATGVKLVHENGLHMDGIYGYADKPLNLDTIDLPYGYIYRIIDDTGLTGSKPFSAAGGGNSGVLMGFSSYTDGLKYGCQTFFGFNQPVIVCRNAAWTSSGATWGTWQGVGTSMLQLLNINNVPTTATSYDCPWQNYNLLIIQLKFYGNVINSIVVPRSYFSGTTDSGRIIISGSTTRAGQINTGAEVWQNGSGKVKILMNAQQSSTGVQIFGMF